MNAVAGQHNGDRILGGLCPAGLDGRLVGVVLALLGLGLVMVTSSSMTIADRHTGNPFYYTVRQGIYMLVGVSLALAIMRVRLVHWQRASMVGLFLALALLLVVLVPGVGRNINGSTRWIGFGPINLQVSEPAKLLLMIYLAGYLVRRGEEVRSQASGFLKPLAVIGVACVLLLMEPDFGTAVVLLATALAMMFLGGVRWWQFALLVGGALLVLSVLAVSSPYRLQRLTTFLNPWADPFSSGFQLTQSLIAFGRGGWFGVGLGNSIQKLFYLPEAHTDFLMAVLAEELGLAGVLSVIAMYAYLVWKAFAIGAVAERVGDAFGAYLSYGIGTWLGLQSSINMGVNMGLLPTKGLTLPLLSYGGSSLITTCVAVALLLRVDYESRCSVHSLPGGAGTKRRRGSGTRPGRRR
ncbi:MAG TPA: putative lipid II flippase FtsW [Gammaproteobacteria bacterium]|nr:putative lipid II flippase FtsW [Gammaproteobacteria bacterium]